MGPFSKHQGKVLQSISKHRLKHRAMKLSAAAAFGLSISSAVALALPQQLPFTGLQPAKDVQMLRESHLSEWCALSKQDFLDDLRKGKAQDWQIVMGNEAGDLDSLVSAIALAYDIAHTKHKPAKAIPLLQIVNSAIDLRPENKLALQEAKMKGGHEDLLTLDDLPFEPAEIGRMVKGIMLVDHNRPLSWWGTTPVLGIVDHHSDRGVNLTANPRLIEPSGSCSSLITSLVLSHKHSHGPVPRSLGDLILSAIAIDTKGLKKGQAIDRLSAEAIFPHSHSSEEDFEETMKDLGKRMKKAKKDLGHLNVTQLIQRDWKGDIVNDSTIPIHLGFASIPVSLHEMINRTEEQSAEAFFAIEAAWAEGNHVDIAVILTSYKDEKGDKQREIVLTVRSGHRIDEKEAQRLFTDVKRDIEASDELKLRPWDVKQDLGKWRYAWVHNRDDGGRKVVRPLVEKAVKHW